MINASLSHRADGTTSLVLTDKLSAQRSAFCVDPWLDFLFKECDPEAHNAAEMQVRNARRATRDPNTAALYNTSSGIDKRDL